MDRVGLDAELSGMRKYGDGAERYARFERPLFLVSFLFPSGAAECSPDAHSRYSGMSQPDCVASPGLHRPNSPIPQPACCSFAHNDLVGERGDACSYENPPHVVYSLCRVRYERPRPCRWILTLPHEVRPVQIWSAAISFVSEDHGVSCVLNVPRSSITCFDCVSARTSCPPLTAQ